MNHMMNVRHWIYSLNHYRRRYSTAIMSHPWTGFERPTRKVSWLRRDTLLFNLSIGCKADEPQFVYVSRRDVEAE